MTIRHGEFTLEQILEGFRKMEFNTENLETLQGEQSKFDTSQPGLELCRTLVKAVQGEEAGAPDNPIAYSRYHKRVSRMFEVIGKARRDAAKIGTTETESTVTEQSSEGENSSQGSVDTAGASADNGGTASTSPTNPAAGGRTEDMAKAATKKAATKKAPPKKDKAPKGPGVIDTIVDVLKNGGGTITEIAAKVHKQFKDRELDGITATVKIQVNRLMLPKEKGGRNLKIKRERTEGSNVLVYKI